MSEPDALTFRAAELLRAADVANMIASVKVVDSCHHANRASS
jgi:hypothetical protein